MIFHCWDIPTFSLELPPHSEIDVLVKPIIKRTVELEGICEDEVNRTVYYQCSRQKLQSLLFNETLANEVCMPGYFDNCTIPQVSYLARPRNGVKYCSKNKSASCTAGIVVSACSAIRTMMVEGCHAPCENLYNTFETTLIPGTFEFFPNISL